LKIRKYTRSEFPPKLWQLLGANPASGRLDARLQEISALAK